MLAAYDAIDDVLDDRFSYEAMSLAEEDSKRNKVKSVYGGLKKTTVVLLGLRISLSCKTLLIIFL